MKKLFAAILPIFLLFSCKIAQKAPQKTDQGWGKDGQIDLVFLQMNDVYEIAPLENGRVGGLARVASLRQKLLAENPNALSVLVGDFISPSVVGSLKYEGKRIRGRQMIETLNALGLDLACFGNHEFDHELEDLQARLDESNFPWLAANVFKNAPARESFRQRGADCPISKDFEMTDADGTTARFTIFGATVTAAKKPYVGYEEPLGHALKEAERASERTDFSIGMTHLFKNQDRDLAAQLNAKKLNVPLIMGGHDHDNMRFEVGKTVVAKADANAKTVYVHRLRFDKKTRTCTVRSELVQVGPDLGEEPKTAAAVEKWQQIASKTFETSGFAPQKIVAKLDVPLDCRDIMTRSQPMPIGQLLTASMLKNSKTGAHVALLNSGSMRIDDFLRGEATEYDIIRLLPFGGGFVDAEMSGEMLLRALKMSEANKGRGGFLQTAGVVFDAAASTGSIIGKPIEPAARYKVVLTDFLLTGGESGLEFLKAEGNADLKILSRPDPKDRSDLRNDIRWALIEHWRK